MWQKLLGGVLTCLLALGGTGAAQAAKAQEEPKLVDQVRKAIDLGVDYLKSQERNGRWEHNGAGGTNPGGGTSLALLALLNAGVKPSDPVIQRGLKYLRSMEPERTYVVGLQTMVYAEARFKEDLPRIQRNVKWLLAARVFADKEQKQFRGWGYTRGGGSDNSNTQYALLGLHAAKQAGIAIDRSVWSRSASITRASRTRTARLATLPSAAATNASP